MSTWVDTKDPAVVDRWIAANGERACEMYYTTDPRFALWMYYLDIRVQRATGINIFTFEDWYYYDNYEDGMSPQEAAVEFLAYMGVTA